MLADIWQVSDMLGNHQFQQQAQFASRSNTYNVSTVYTYARFRPTFSLALNTDSFYTDVEQDQRRREMTGVGYATYPLDRVSSVSLGAGATSRRDSSDSGAFAPAYFNDRYLISSYDYDTVTGHYLGADARRTVVVVLSTGLSTRSAATSVIGKAGRP